MALGTQEVILMAIIGALAAIIYSLRVLVLMERRISRIEGHLESIVSKILREQLKIEHSLAMKKTSRTKSSKAKPKKKKSKKRR